MVSCRGSTQTSSVLLSRCESCIHVPSYLCQTQPVPQLFIQPTSSSNGIHCSLNNVKSLTVMEAGLKKRGQGTMILLSLHWETRLTAMQIAKGQRQPTGLRNAKAASFCNPTPEGRSRRDSENTFLLLACSRSGNKVIKTGGGTGELLVGVLYTKGVCGQLEGRCRITGLD